MQRRIGRISCIDDATKTELFGINASHHVWKWKNAELHPKKTKPTEKHRVGSIMLLTVIPKTPLWQ